MCTDSVDNVTLDVNGAGQREATIEFIHQAPLSQLSLHSSEGEQDTTDLHEQVRKSKADV
jgi:hypothetical protein